MSTPTCGATNDGARCAKPFGHFGDHNDGGYIWTQRADEPGMSVAKLRAENRELRRRVRLARAACAGDARVEALLDLRLSLDEARLRAAQPTDKPLPKARKR